MLVEQLDTNNAPAVYTYITEIVRLGRQQYGKRKRRPERLLGNGYCRPVQRKRWMDGISLYAASVEYATVVVERRFGDLKGADARLNATVRQPHTAKLRYGTTVYYHFQLLKVHIRMSRACERFARR